MTRSRKPKIRLAVSPRLPKIPDLDKNTAVICYLGMATPKVAQVLKFPTATILKIEAAYNQFSVSEKESYVPLVSGQYGTFWYSSVQGLFFELVHSDIVSAINSLEEPLKLLDTVNSRVDLHLHLNIGTRHLGKVDQVVRAFISLVDANPTWKYLEIRYPVVKSV